ncbi:hypothetical protein MC7420_7142 [Coleofasciculus chthonoplastes PCC 7420]|uniref:Uncharacterized protein n=1 Tax=Coleofasciculus chthonoplastes PCC 7420 TaxID=118168 RepID=B4VH54_9CYAN|nr:hypothetical protein [Coleofasciculus chthonoplastes]EDX78489.1 hypothetical protein MC7420_7142 [Coleofasciculus chthonoplastes PCC 7420]
MSNVKKGNRKQGTGNREQGTGNRERFGSGGLRRIEHLTVISLIKYPPNPPYNYCE